MTFTRKKFAGFLLFFIFSTSAMLAQSQQKVSDAELEKFTVVFQQMRMMNNEVQQQMTTIIEDEEMPIQRFNEIHKAHLDPAVEVEASAEEQKQYEVIVAEIENIQVEFRQEIEEMIEEGGLSFERYEQIGKQLQNDAELQQRLREELTN